VPKAISIVTSATPATTHEVRVSIKERLYTSALDSARYRLTRRLHHAPAGGLHNRIDNKSECYLRYRLQRSDCVHCRRMERRKNKERVVKEAVALMGHQELAGRLGVSMEHVSSWLDGTAIIPDAALISLSEILLSWSGKQRFK
jgi:hypothetical protein